MDIIDEYNRAASFLEALISGTAPSMFEQPTPCSNWTVLALIEHVVGSTGWFASLITGEPFDRAERTVGVRDNPAHEFSLAVDGYRSTISAPGVMDSPYRHPRFEVSGATLTRVLGNEYLVHGWDLAQATGQAGELPEDLAATFLSTWRELMGDFVREPGGPFGVEQPVSDGASAGDQLVGFFGRTP